MAEISGTILNEKGFAIENAIVAIFNRIAYTDELGRFTLENIPLGTAYLVAEHRDYNQYVQSLMVENDQPDLVLSMTPITTIKTGL